VVRFDDGGLLVLDRNLLVRRIFGGLLAYDVVDTLAAGSRTGAKRARHVAGCLQHLAEVYALEVLQAVTTGGLGRSRVYDDAALQKPSPARAAASPTPRWTTATPGSSSRSPPAS
jgi:hypothetical protein